MHRLIPHSDHPPAMVDAIGVEIDRSHGTWSLTYTVSGAGALVAPELAAPERTDGLWKTTCFELFVKPTGGEAYFEFNLSPSTQWAAYAFDGYRGGMRELALPVPQIERRRDGLQATLDLSGLPAGHCRVALTAVIEETLGRTSYWALAHAPGKPDFHRPEGFVLDLR